MNGHFEALDVLQIRGYSKELGEPGLFGFYRGSSTADRSRDEKEKAIEGGEIREGERKRRKEGMVK